MSVSPDQRAFEADAAKAAFRLGVVEGRWQLIEICWPFVLISVVAKDGVAFLFRLECNGYPQAEPTGGPWDMERDAVLAAELWPKGNGGRVSAVFRPEWQEGRALYLPCDRVSISGHDPWKTEMPSKIWRPADGVVQYLEQVHELLNSRDYLPQVRTAA